MKKCKVIGQVYTTFNSTMSARCDISCDDPAIISYRLASDNLYENNLDLLLLRRIEPVVFCQYCGQYPAHFKCYDCWKTNYCCIECWDCDYADHANACAILQLSRGDLACRG